MLKFIQQPKLYPKGKNKVSKPRSVISEEHIHFNFFYYVQSVKYCCVVSYKLSAVNHNQKRKTNPFKQSLVVSC